MSEYNKGYTEGYNRALNEMAKRISTFYSYLGGKTVGGSVGYHIEQIRRELLLNGCVVCGVEIPEGRMVCPNCERKDD